MYQSVYVSGIVSIARYSAKLQVYVYSTIVHGVGSTHTENMAKIHSLIDRCYMIIVYSICWDYLCFIV